MKSSSQKQPFADMTYFVVVKPGGLLLGPYCNSSRQIDPKLYRYRGVANSAAKRIPGAIVRECTLILGATFQPVEDYRKMYGHDSGH